MSVDWKQRCGAAEATIEYILEMDRRRDIWIEEVIDALGYWVADRDELDGIMSRFSQLAPGEESNG